MSNRDFESATGPVPHVSPSKEDQREAIHLVATAQNDAINRVACRAGDDSCAQGHVSSLSRSGGGPQSANRSLLQLQRQYGNRYVEKVLSLSEATVNREEQHETEHGGSEVGPHVESAIEKERGTGHGLDTGVRRQMESSMGADFSGVRVHTDQRSDSLNRSLSARAFTTGHDIFFREGAYQPGSSVGRELIAHELTHVVQQDGNAVKRAMSVSQPGDPHEVEAETTARTVMQEEHSNGADHEHKEKEEEHASVMTSAAETDGLQRQPEALKGKDEDEEHKKGQMVHTKHEQVARKIRKAT